MTPAHIQHLAPELLDHILSYLFEKDGIHGIRPSITDLISVSCTSQLLRPHALRVVYRDIQLSDHSSPLRIKLLLRTLLNKPELLEHIRTINLETNDLNELNGDGPRPKSTANFTLHDIGLLSSFMLGIGMKPMAVSWWHFVYFRNLRSNETTQVAEFFPDSPVPVALIVALLLTCSSSKPLDLGLVMDEAGQMDEFWEIFKHVTHWRRVGGLRHLRQLSYVGHARHFGGGFRSMHMVGNGRAVHHNQFALLFRIPMESILLSSSCWDPLVPQFRAGDQSALTSMTLRECKTGPLVSILRVCPHLKTLNFTGVINWDSFDAKALGITLGHVSSLEHLDICFESRRYGHYNTHINAPPWLRGNIGTLQNLARLQTLELPTQLLLGWGLDTPRLPLWDVFPASLRELRLRDDGSTLSSYCWSRTLSPLCEYLDWRAKNSSTEVVLDRIRIHQRGSRLESAVVEELQQKCDRLGITIGSLTSQSLCYWANILTMNSAIRAINLQTWKKSFSGRSHELSNYEERDLSNEYAE
jgi:hypothetical protein